MKDTDLNHYKIRWKEEKGFGEKSLSKDDIHKYMHATSKGIAGHFKKGLITDMVLKSLLVFSFLVLLFFFRHQPFIVLLTLILLTVTLAGILFQVKTYHKVPLPEDEQGSIKSFLERLLAFYHKNYILSLVFSALSSTLFFLSGSMGYYHFRYQTIPPFQTDDFVVLFLGLVLSFGLSLLAYLSHYRSEVKQLESTLQEIDEERLTAATLAGTRKKRLRNLLVYSILLLAGLLLFLWIFFSWGT